MATKHNKKRNMGFVYEALIRELTRAAVEGKTKRKAKLAKTIRESFGNLIDWKNLDDLIPQNFKSNSKYKRTGKAGIFAGSLELVKEGNLTMKQDKLFDDIYVKENND